MKRPSWKPLVCLAAAAGLGLAACGGSATEDTTDAAESTAATDATTTTEAAEETTTTALPTKTAPPVTEPDNPVDQYRPELVLAPISAGPISLTPTLCDLGGLDFVTSSSPEALGVTGNHLFLATEGGATAFTVDLTDGCTLTPNTAFGDNGLFASEDSLYTITGGSNGFMLISFFTESVVVDTNTGLSYSCDDLDGFTQISPDGTQAFEFWPGFEENAQFDLTTTNCVENGTFEIPDAPGELRGAFLSGTIRIGFDLLVEQGEDSWTTASLYDENGLLWQIGQDDFSVEPYFASIDGIVPCGLNTCVNDGFFGPIYVVSDDGTVLAKLDGDDLSSGEAELAFITSDSAGNLFGIVTQYADPGSETEDESDDLDRIYYNYVVSIEATG